MDAFVSRKRLRVEESPTEQRRVTEHRSVDYVRELSDDEDAESTEMKLAVLASQYRHVDSESLLDLLISAGGSVEKTTQMIGNAAPVTSPRKRSAPGTGFQASMASFQRRGASQSTSLVSPTALTRKGVTLHLYTAEDVAVHTPCSIIHNFLPASEANELLLELLEEAKTFGRQSIKVFDNIVQSPHSACFYVDTPEEEQKQRKEYLYNGQYLEDIRPITPQMRFVSSKVQLAVNDEIAKRIETRYPGSKKLRFQSPDPWIPNAAFVNRYQGGAESVGYHSDQLTYLGPRAVIGSLSLGVAREFRVRKIVARDADDPPTPEGTKKPQRADIEGQIAIHLPHNSLLVMHAEVRSTPWSVSFVISVLLESMFQEEYTHVLASTVSYASLSKLPNTQF